jgi:hypothetical protein
MTTESVTRVELYYAIEDAFDAPPVSASDLMVTAGQHHARIEVLNALAQLPHDRSFRHLREVWDYYPEMPTGSMAGL